MISSKFVSGLKFGVGLMLLASTSFGQSTTLDPRFGHLISELQTQKVDSRLMGCQPHIAKSIASGDVVVMFRAAEHYNWTVELIQVLNRNLSILKIRQEGLKMDQSDLFSSPIGRNSEGKKKEFIEIKKDLDLNQQKINRVKNDLRVAKHLLEYASTQCLKPLFDFFGNDKKKFQNTLAGQSVGSIEFAEQSTLFMDKEIYKVKLNLRTTFPGDKEKICIDLLNKSKTKFTQPNQQAAYIIPEFIYFSSFNARKGESEVSSAAKPPSTKPEEPTPIYSRNCRETIERLTRVADSPSLNGEKSQKALGAQ